MPKKPTQSLATTIILVRHGEGKHQLVAKRGVHLRFATQAGLTVTGKRQVARLAKRFAGRMIDVMYISPFRRALETAAILKRKAIVKRAILNHRLVEKSSGALAGQPVSGTERRLHLLSHRQLRYLRPPGGESWHDLCRRIRPVLTEILDRQRGKTVMVVSHGHVNRAFIHLLTGLRFTVWSEQHNAAHNEFVIRGRHITIKHLNA